VKTQAPLLDRLDPEGCPRGGAQKGEMDFMREDTHWRARLLHLKVSDSPCNASHILYDNDPSAGSPTETLLRLLLPLNDQV
jgi:hypothetical protein